MSPHMGQPRPTAAASHPSRGAARSGGVADATYRCTLAAFALALAASLSGLLIDGVYAGAASTAEMFRGYDLVTAVAVGLGLVVVSRPARLASARARLATTGLAAYLVYTYAYYLFGTGFNGLFLLHVGAFVTAAAALVLHLTDLDLSSVEDLFGVLPRVRAVAGILGGLAVALGGMWVYLAVDNAVTGETPAGSRLVETETVVHLGMALDLTLLVPLYTAAAVLLLRRARWGYVLAAVALFAGILHQVGYIVAMPFQVAADIPGAVAYDPGEPVIVLLYLIAAGLLLVQTRRRSGEAS